MHRACTILAFLVAGVPALAAPVDPGGKPAEKRNPNGSSVSPEQQYQQLFQESMSAAAQAQKAGRAGGRGGRVAQPDGKAKKLPKPERLDVRFLKLALHYPRSRVAVDALIWVVNYGRPQQANRAVEVLAERYPKDVKIGAVLRRVVDSDTPAAEKLLKVLQTTAAPDIQARAHLWRADHLMREAERVEVLKSGKRPELEKELGATLDDDALKRLKAADPAELRKDAETLYERTAKTFPDVRLLPLKGTVADAAKDALFELRHLRVGQAAPELKSVDVTGQEFALGDHRGKRVLVLFSPEGIEGCKELNEQVRGWQQAGGSSPTVIQVGSKEGRSGGEWHVRAWPTAYLIDARGVIRDKRVGVRDTAALVEQQLKEKK
jgi:hypothetical protein